jgi:plasmid maintenance system antidote protein VapI
MKKITLIPPGEILLTEFMEPNEISQAKIAGDLGIPQKWSPSFGQVLAVF